MSGFGELDGIAHQIVKYLEHSQRVTAVELWQLIRIRNSEFQLLGMGSQAHGRLHLHCHGPQREINGLKLKVALFQLGCVQNVVNETQQRLGSLSHCLEMRALCVVESGLKQQLREPD